MGGGTGVSGARADLSLAALVGGDGRYVLNGNWAGSPPGTYEAAGTRVVYTRAAGPEEMLSAAGPTSQDLLLQVRAGLCGGRLGSEAGVGDGGDGWVTGRGGRQGSERGSQAMRSRCDSLGMTPLQVLLQEPNPGIEFEFWLPRERYGPFQTQAQALGWSLRQQQPREVEPQPPELPAAPATIVPRIPTPTPGEAGMARVGASREGRTVPLTVRPPQTPAHPAPTLEVEPTACSTIAGVTLVRDP